MRTYDIVHCDVFSSKPGTGNPLAVVLDAQGLETEQMQAIAHWLNLAETTFVLPATAPDADYRVRIFTTRKEIAFAGHPSIGTAHALLDSGLLPREPGLLRQECKAGILPLKLRPELQNNAIAVRVPSARIVRYATSADSGLIAALPGDCWGQLKPALVEGGRRWWLAEMHNENAVRQFQPDSATIARLAAETDSLGLCIFAPAVHGHYRMAVRAFPLGVGISEDPASGAANAAITAFLAEAGELERYGQRYTVSQGREIGHDALLSLECDGAGDIWVGGDSHTIIHGRLAWQG